MLNRYYDDVINVPAACIYAKLARSMGMAMIANINALFVTVAHNCHPNRTFLIQPFLILNISNFKISNLNISNFNINFVYSYWRRACTLSGALSEK